MDYIDIKNRAAARGYKKEKGKGFISNNSEKDFKKLGYFQKSFLLSTLFSHLHFLATLEEGRQK